MSVDIEQLPARTSKPTETRYWRITAMPDSGKAFWQVTVVEDPGLMYPMRRVIIATRRAIRIDREFSNQAIERRGKKREKRQVATRLVAAALAAREEQSPDSREENVA